MVTASNALGARQEVGLLLADPGPARTGGNGGEGRVPVVGPDALVVIEVLLEGSEVHSVLHAGAVHVARGNAPVANHGAARYRVDELPVVADAGEFPPEGFPINHVELK